MLNPLNPQVLSQENSEKNSKIIRGSTAHNIERIYNDTYKSQSNSYSSKKYSVMFLLVKMLYVGVICVLFGLGMFNIMQSGREDLKQDKDDFNRKSYEWNITNREILDSWDISIYNDKGISLDLIEDNEKMHKYDDKKELFYNPLQMVRKDISPLISNIQLKKTKSDASVSL